MSGHEKRREWNAKVGKSNEKREAGREVNGAEWLVN